MSGPERFKTITSSYYRGAHAIFVMYDITDRAAFDNVRLWVSEIQRFNDRAVFMIIGNKCDLEDSRCVTTSEGEALAAELGAAGFRECSSKLNINVQEAVRAMIGSIFVRIAASPDWFRENRTRTPTATRPADGNKMCNLL